MRDAYREALSRLTTAGMGVPLTTDLMAAVTPHLTAAQRGAILSHLDIWEARPDCQTYWAKAIAAPPLLVRGGVRTIEFRPAGTYRPTGGPVEVHPRRIGLGEYTTRPSVELAFVAEAEAHAEKTWGADLADRVWNGSVVLSFCDPVGKTPQRHSVTLGIGGTWESLRPDVPKSAAVEASTMIAGYGWLDGEEIVGEGTMRIAEVCCRCAAPLSITNCSGCGLRFPDDGGRGWLDIAATPRAVRVLVAQGHAFTRDPSVARGEEARRMQSASTR